VHRREIDEFGTIKVPHLAADDEVEQLAVGFAMMAGLDPWDEDEQVA